MNNNNNISEKDLDEKLERTRIRLKAQNIADLEEIASDNLKRLKSVRWYVYLLIVVHFFLMLNGWSNNAGFVFCANLWMHYWLLKKIYREIYMKIAIPASVFVLFVTLVGFSKLN
jgi:hypothetical protein